MWGFRMRGASFVVLLGVALTGTAVAQEGLPPGPALDAKSFDALTRGKRMDTYDPQTLYGVEEFLPGQKSIWKDAQGCKLATWEQIGDQICFFYEDRPNDPACWIYKPHEGAVWGWYQGDVTGPTVRLVPGNTPMDCNYLGA